jgi:V8-like Glu-specific endopeptidase
MSRLKVFRIVGLGVMALALVTGAFAQAPMTVGEKFPINLRSDRSSDVKPVPTETGWLYQLHHPGATYIALHFADIGLAAGDRLVISDPLGSQSYTLRGRGKLDAGTFWARHIKGDTVLIELIPRLMPDKPQAAPELATTKAGQAFHGFVVDQYAAGFVDLGQPKAICGTDDKENAICYSSSHPNEYNTARAVARLLIAGSSLCTGWLVSADNLLLTNEHCISSNTTALNTDYEFMAEAPTCGSSNCQLCYPGTVFSGGTLIKDSANLDYALIEITSGNPAATYGYMTIDNRRVTAGEQIYIPQHPGGRAKELGIFSSASQDPGGVCTVYSTSEPPCSGSGYTDVGYYCDTEGGSSGSPVLTSANDKVVALHHCALCPNRGVPIDLVYAEISQYLGFCGDGTCGGSEDSCTCPEDCGAPPTSETTCDDGIDNDCDGNTDCDDADCTGTPSCICDNDGTCETGEDCNNCANDCISGTSGAVCGNGLCETADGEDCKSCPDDCAGKTTGAPSGRYCCGDTVTCGDDRCTTGGYSCTNVPQGGEYCCGDGLCEGAEDGLNCAIDCSGTGYCGDGTCDPGEDTCSCPADCGYPPSSEIPSSTCDDGIDNDCDLVADCADGDCDTDPACAGTCAPVGDPCTVNEDCCSLNCGGPTTNRKCKK